MLDGVTTPANSDKFVKRLAELEQRQLVPPGSTPSKPKRSRRKSK
jgi:hypothetical protein